MDIKISHLAILLIITFSLSFAQETINEKNIWMVSTLVKLQNNIKKFDDKISHYEIEISKCDRNISVSENIITAAKQKGNLQAEKTAKDALQKSSAAKEKNISLLNSMKNLKKQGGVILSSVKNKLYKKESSVEAVTLKYTGDISIRKNNGEQYNLDDSRGLFIEDGDFISTSANSKIDLQFLGGRGDLSIGENTGLKFFKSDSLDVIDVISGRIKAGVKKTDEFEKDLYEKYEEYKSIIGSIPSWDVFLKSYKSRLAKKFNIRTTGGTAAIRGTEFILCHNENKGTEIIVLEGSVEMTSNDGLNSIIINSGHKGLLNINGEIAAPEKIDMKNSEKWWEED